MANDSTVQPQFRSYSFTSGNVIKGARAMTGQNWRTVLAAAISSSMVFVVMAGAQAHDEGRWERERWAHERWEHRHHHERVEHRHREPVSRVVYERQPLMVMPAPVYQAPAYSQPVDPSVNLNFTIPLR
jgi:hypothetical protein